MKTLIAAVAVLLLSGCATRGALEAETLARQQHERTVESKRIFDADEIRSNRDELGALRLRIDNHERWVNEIHARIKYLEQLAAPNDPDGLAEDPDLRTRDFESDLKRMGDEVRALKTDWNPKDDFAKLSEQVAAEVDAKFCLKGLETGDEFLIKVACKMGCDALANLSSDLEMTDRVRGFVFAEVKKCRTARQDRAFNRLVCGKDECPK